MERQDVGGLGNEELVRETLAAVEEFGRLHEVVTIALAANVTRDPETTRGIVELDDKLRLQWGRVEVLVGELRRRGMELPDLPRVEP